jgi:hypothetical protein
MIDPRRTMFGGSPSNARAGLPARAAAPARARL